MPDKPCAHTVIEAAGTVSANELAKLKEAAPHAIALGYNSFKKFRDLVINDQRLGSRFEHILPVVWHDAVEEYNANLKQPGGVVVEPSGDTPIYHNNEFNNTDGAHHNTLLEYIARITESGDLAKYRGGEGDGGQRHHDVNDAMAKNYTLKEIFDPTTPHDGPLATARTNVLSTILKHEQRLKDDLAKANAILERERNNVSSTTLLGKAQTDYDNAYANWAYSSLQLSHILAVSKGASTAAGRYLGQLARVSHAMNLGVPEAREFYDTFSHRLDIDLPLPTDSTPIAQSIKPSGSDNSVVTNQLTKDLAAKKQRTEAIANNRSANKPTKTSDPENASDGAKILAKAKLAARPDVLTRLKNAASKLTAIQMPKDHAMRDDLGFFETPDPVKNAVTEMVEILHKEIDPDMTFRDTVSFIRDNTDFNRDFTESVGKKGTPLESRMIDHVEAIREAYEGVTGKKIKDSAVTGIKTSIKRAIEKALDPKDPGDPVSEPGLFDPDSVHNATQGLSPENYVPHSKRAAGSEGRDKTLDYLKYLGGYTFKTLKDITGNDPSYSRWVAEMKNHTGTDFTPVDLEAAWKGLHTFANERIVKPRIDMRNAAMNDASRHLSASELQEYIKLTKDIDPDSPDAPYQQQLALHRVKDGNMGLLELGKNLFQIHRAFRFSEDFSVFLTHPALIVLDPRRLPQTMHIASQAFAGAMDRSVYEEIQQRFRDPKDPKYFRRMLYGRGQFKDVAGNQEELFASNLLSRISEASYNKDTSTRLSKAMGKDSSVVEIDVPFLKNLPKVSSDSSPVTSKLGPVELFTRMKTNKTVDRSSDGKISFDMNPIGQLGRSIAASERHFVLFNNLLRDAMMDASFDQLEKMGYDSFFDQHEFQQVADNIAIFTGATNLSKGTDEFMKNMSYILSAPKYQTSQLQAISRVLLDSPGSMFYDFARNKISPTKRNQIEGYLPSTKDIRHTPYHTTPERSVYNSRYIGVPARVQLLNMVGGMAAGTLLSILMYRLAGGEVHTDPRDDAFMKARFKNRTFALPGAGIYNWIRFAAVVNASEKFKQPKYTRPRPGIVGINPTRSDNAIRTPLTARDRKDKGGAFLQGKLAPGIQMALKMFLGSDGIGQPAYKGRFVGKGGRKISYTNKNAWNGILHDVFEDSAPLSIKDTLEAWQEKDPENVENILALTSMFGVSNSPTRFKKDPLYTGR